MKAKLKRLLSGVLALAMAVSVMAVPAFAEEVRVYSDTTLDHDVTSNYVHIEGVTLTIPAEYSLEMVNGFYMEAPSSMNVYGKLTGTVTSITYWEDEDSEARSQIKVFDDAYVDFTYPTTPDNGSPILDDFVVYAGTDESKAAKLTITDNGDGTKTAKFDDRAPTHTHNWDTKWSNSDTAHWYKCTADGCDINDYSTCGEDGAAYGAHDWSNKDGECGICGKTCDHTYGIEGEDIYTCTVCGYVDEGKKPAPASEPFEEIINGIKYRLDPNDATATIIGYVGTVTELNVSTVTYDGKEYNVTAVGEGAFSRCYALNSVKLPNVTEIGQDAFYDCDNLNSVELPKSRAWTAVFLTRSNEKPWRNVWRHVCAVLCSSAAQRTL